MEKEKFSPSNDILALFHSKKLREVVIAMDREFDCLFFSEKVNHELSTDYNITNPLHLTFYMKDDYLRRKEFYCFFKNGFKIIEYNPSTNEYFKILPDDSSFKKQINYVKIQVWHMFMLDIHYYSRGSRNKHELYYDITKFAVNESQKAFLGFIEPNEDTVGLDPKVIFIQRTNGYFNNKTKYVLDIITKDYSALASIYDLRMLYFNKTKQLLSFLYNKTEGLLLG